MKDTRLIWKVTFLYTSNEQVAYEIKNTLSFTLEPPKCEILRYKSRKDVQKQMRKNYKTLMKDFEKDWLILSRCSAFPIWPVNSTSVSSVAQSCPTLCDPMNHSMPGLPVYHQLSRLFNIQPKPSLHQASCHLWNMSCLFKTHNSCLYRCNFLFE